MLNFSCYVRLKVSNMHERRFGNVARNSRWHVWI